jgi:transcriptional regulator
MRGFRRFCPRKTILSNDHKMIERRRNKVLELSSQGHTQTEIADILQVS